MFPTQNLHYKHQQQLQQQQQHRRQRCYEEDGYGTGCGGEIISYYSTTGGSFDLMRKIAAGYECYSEVCLESSDLVLAGDRMAEDGSRTSSVNETGSSSKLDHVVAVVQQADDDQRDIIDHEKWLQLGLGSTSTTSAGNSELNLMMNPVVMAEQQQPRRGTTGLVELDLLSQGTQLDVKPLAPIFHMTTEQFRPAPLRPPPINNYTHSGTSFSNMPAALLIQQQQRTSLNLAHHHHHHHHHLQGPAEIVPWGSYRPAPNLWNPTVASSSSSVPMASYISRSFQQYPNVVDTAGPSSDMMMRVVDAPPRPHSGIWFVLQASQNQSKEPFLPQIPKSYLRIKDGRMTVRLLMKYLVNKLRLNSESEIEIRCRGQKVDALLTLQHVRDNIWSSKDMVTLLPDSSTSDHIMILHYARTTTTTTAATTTTTSSTT